MSVIDKVRKRFLKKKEKTHNLAVFVDGPNILRREFSVDLLEIKKMLKEFGSMKIAKVFLNQFASQKLVEAVVNQGFEPVVTVGDVDVAMIAEAVEAVYNPAINSIAFVTRDSDFLPAVIKAKRAGKETIVMLSEEASAAALKNTADHVLILPKK